MLISCAVTKNNDIEILDSKIISKRYLSLFFPEIENYIDKEDAKYSHIYIDKSKMSLSQFNSIRKNLKKDGWVLKNENKYYFEYCLSEDYYLSFLYPIEGIKQYRATGLEVNYEHLDKWLVIYSYNRFGVSHCRKI